MELVTVLSSVCVFRTGTPEGRPADTRDQLMDIASCYATAISLSPSDSRGHLGLALALEEQFYCEDMYGIEQEVKMQIFM